MLTGQVQQSYPVGQPRADFNVNDFQHLIYQKGRRVWFEKAIQCPCKSPAINQQSNCKNCGGGGWIYINGKETRMVISGVGVVNDYKAWSEESRGMINISCRDSEQLTFMDRLTLLDGKSINQEVVFPKPQGTGALAQNGDYLCWTTYPIKQLLMGGAFISVNQKLTLLGTDDIELGVGNILKIKAAFIATLTDEVKASLAITLRYYHAPQYYIVEMKRETMQTFKFELGTEKLQNMPLSGIARRAHYFPEAPNTTNDRFVDNNYTEVVCGGVYGNIGLSCDCECISTIIIKPSTVAIDILPFGFTNTNQVNIAHNFATNLITIQIYDQLGEQIEGLVTIVDSNNVTVKFNQQVSGTIILTRKLI